MGWQITVLSTPILLALLVSLFMFGYIVTVYRNRRREPLVALYFWITVAAIVWLGFSALKLLQTEPETKLLFYRLLHLGAAVLPPLIFLFVVAFTDRTRWLRDEVVGALFLVPVLFLVLLFVGPDGFIVAGTNVLENDIVVLRVTDGPGFLLFSVYSVLLVVATLALVLLEIRRFGSTYYPQASLIAIAVITPMLFSVLTTAGVSPFVDERINLVPTSAAVSVASFGLLLYRYRLIDLPPLAYATAMKYSPDALFVLNQEAQVVSTNQHGRELLEMMNGSLGTPLSDCVPAFDPELSSELVELDPPSAESTYHRVFVEPLTRGEKHVGWVVVFRDETDQQRRQERLQQKTEQLEVFTSTISHDLRNPLNVASLYLEMAQEEFDSEELDNVEQAHDRMEEIIEKVLTLARAGKQIDAPEAVPMEMIIQRAWENVTTPAAELTVKENPTIMADPTMVQHVFENLFRNSVEHGSTGNRPKADDSVEHGSTGNRPKADDSVEHGSTGSRAEHDGASQNGGDDLRVTVGTLDDGIYVEDDGPGIPPEKREDVLEVGYTSTEDGTGLGLNIVKQIVDAHGWEIRVTDGTDGGARFEITGVERAE